MSITDPPAIRWIPQGEHAGFYIYCPALNGKWRKVDLVFGLADIVREVPEGSQGLYCYDDVSDLIDQYRDTLLDHQEAIREDGDDYDPHGGARDEVLRDLVDSEDYAVELADQLYKQASQGQP